VPSLIVANLDDTIIGIVWVTSSGEGRSIEKLGSSLVNAEDVPFGG